MYQDEKKILDNKMLKEVTGGAKDTSEFTSKRDEFEQAWKKANMDSKGYSGMAKAEMFDKWESENYKTDATAFLLNI